MNGSQSEAKKKEKDLKTSVIACQDEWQYDKESWETGRNENAECLSMASRRKYDFPEKFTSLTFHRTGLYKSDDRQETKIAGLKLGEGDKHMFVLDLFPT